MIQLNEKTIGWKTTIENPKSDTLVILCHGWRSGPAKIKHLAMFLKKNKFAVYRLNLSTTFGAVSTIVKQTEKQLTEIRFGQDYKKVHFIGHSFGGIITKIILNNNKFANGDKYITLGTPWGGTSLSKKIESKVNFGDDPALFGNGLKLLKIALANRMANPKIKIGLIGGNKPYIDKKSLDNGEEWDGTVPSKSALSLTENVVDRKVVHLNHTELINNTLTGNMILKFFKNGRF